jgi:crotonobetainyl-CoA:carnitine CoA-transferase CaiB-like acyl-CoA transferase
LELANFISGPYAAVLLSDLGAEVIKVEAPGSGDPFRFWGKDPGRPSPIFTAFNRGKKSVCLDLKTPAGQEACRRLATRADVLVENFRPGVLDRLGLGYEALHAENHRLIYCSLSGMGSSGPAHRRPTYDTIGQAMSGLLSLLTDLDDPQPIGPALADQVTGLFAALGIVSALQARATHGAGQKLELSMLGASLGFLVDATTTYLMEGEVHDLNSRPHASQSYAFVAGDGLPFVIHLSSPHKFWQGLAAATERPDLLDDPRFKTRDDRVEHYARLRERLTAVFRTRSRAEWLARLEEEDVPAAPLYNVAQALADPQVEHLGLLRTFGAGERAVQLVGSPLAFSCTKPEAGLPTPDLGEHSAAILEQLGYSDEDISRLREERVI